MLTLNLLSLNGGTSQHSYVAPGNYTLAVYYPDGTSNLSTFLIATPFEQEF
jgi:hypothetical protein